MTSDSYTRSPKRGRATGTPFTGMLGSDLLLLPEDQRDLAKWLLAQKYEVSLTEVAEYLGQTVAIAQTQLQPLVEQGLVQETQIENERYYGTRFANTRAREIPLFAAPGGPLSVIRNPSRSQSVVAGDAFELSVTVSNQGNQSVVVDVFIKENSQPHFWCAAPRDSLALEPQQGNVVFFEFEVPAQTPPGTYPFVLSVDAPEHYPEDTPLNFPYEVQVLPPVQQTVQVNDPTFTLQPVTTAAKPAVLPLGEVLEVAVLVHNTSDRVDHFSLSCPELEDAWFTVRYPEGLQTAGLVVTTEGLSLNPGARGTILLLIHPPLNAAAGVYSPTLRLHSANNPDLALLDLVYFQVQPLYILNLELRTLLGRVRRGTGHYEVRLVNDGNTDRQIRLAASGDDEDRLCDFMLDPEQVWLPSKTSEVVSLQVQPTKWWRRPLFGGGKLISFFIEVEDVQRHPLPLNRLPGVLVWEARPWWQFLLFLLTTLGTLGLLLFLLWSLLNKPPTVPRIVEFTPDSATYQEGGDSIRLNWQIQNADKLAAIRLTSQSPDGAVTGKPMVIDFSRAKAGEVPPELQPFCGKKLQTILTCKSVPTDARAAGNYLFELALIPADGKAEPTDVKKTGTIAIQPQMPQILSFKVAEQEFATRQDANPANQSTTKVLVPITDRLPIRQLTLSWLVRGGGNFKVELLPSPGTVNPKGAIRYLVTQRSTAETFTLKATNATGQSVSKSVTIEPFNPDAPKPSPSPGATPSPLPTIPVPGSLTLPPPPPTPDGSNGNTPLPPSGTPGGAGSTPGSSTPPSKAAPKNPNAPTPTDPDRLSPSELPPQPD